jgi:hypothetical protein
MPRLRLMRMNRRSVGVIEEHTAAPEGRSTEDEVRFFCSHLEAPGTQADSQQSLPP